MLGTHSASTCRWATPTLFLADAQWLEAWDYSWSCLRNCAPRVLQAPEQCATCARWEERPANETAKAEPPAHVAP